MWLPRDAGNTAAKQEIKRAKDNRTFILWIGNCSLIAYRPHVAVTHRRHLSYIKRIKVEEVEVN